MENKRFLTAQDVMEMLGVSLSYSYKLIRRLNAELEADVFIVKLNYPKLQNKNGHCCKSKLDKVAKVVYRLSGTV